MAHEFIGCSVLITLVSPQAERVQGVVANIERQKLYLTDVVSITSKLKSQSLVVEGHDIADIEVLPTLPPFPAFKNASPEPKIPIDQTLDPPARLPLAILSPLNAREKSLQNPVTSKTVPDSLSTETKESRRGQPQHDTQETSTNQRLQTPPSSISSTNPITDPAILSVRKTQVGKPRGGHNATLSQTDSLVSATLSEPFQCLSLSKNPSGQHLQTGETSPRQSQELLHPGLEGSHESKKRRRRKRKKSEAGEKLAFTPQQSKVSANAATLGHRGPEHSSLYLPRENRASATRDISNDSNDEHMVSRASLVKPDQKSRHLRHHREISQWEVEDASNIHAMPEFDFAANLSKFDKQSVFSQFKNDDATADEARLVGHNRLPRPGTNGGRNLHFSESVLDGPHNLQESGRYSSETRESELEGSFGANRGIYSHRPPSSSRRDYNQTQSATSVSRAASPRLSRSLSSTRMKSVNCTLALTPLQSVEAEALAVSDLGLSEDIMMENASRGIAEVVMRDLKDRAMVIKQPHVIIFAGNHKTGARAIGAGRHLVNHGAQVIVAILDANDGLHGRSNESFLPVVRQALFSFRKSGGKTLPVQTLFRALESPDFSPHVLLDAVHGIHIQIGDLSSNARANVADLLEVFQDSQLGEHVLAVDVPLGRDPITGESVILNGRSSLHWPRQVIFLGTPKTWRDTLLFTAGDEMERTMMLQGSKSWVVDLGFNFAKVKRSPGGGEGGWGRAWVEELDN